MARKLILEIAGDTSGLERSARRASKSIGTLSASFGTLAKSVVVVALVEKAMEGLSEAIHSGTDELKERLTVQAQIDAALKSTGNVAHLTEASIDKLALSLSNLSGTDDEVIKSGEAVLLTFKNIRNFSGKGNDIFDQATAAALDFAVKTGKDIPKAALAVGKALQDPAKASTALRRAQIVLTVAEQKAIKTAIAHGDVLKAQKLILADLQTRYGGQAKAFGETLPGKIAILKQRLRDLAGDLLGKLVPGLDFAATKAVEFVRKFSEASGARAKLSIVFEGAKGIGESLVRVVREGIDQGVEQLQSIDWRHVGDVVSRNLRAGIEYGIAQLARVDWKAQIDRAASAVGSALVATLDKLRGYIERVNWNAVGKAITDGIALAIGALVRFLAKVDWKKVVVAIVRFSIAAIRASQSIINGIGEEIGRLMLRGLEAGFVAVGRWLEVEALKLALKIIEPFSHLPEKLGGGPFQALKAKMQTQLDGLTKTTEKSGEDAGKAYSAGFVKGATTPISEHAMDAIANAQTKTSDTTTTTPPPPNPTGTHRNRQRVIDLKNRVFDNAIARELDRAGDLPLKKQIAKLKTIAKLIVDRIAATKDITRRLELEDRLRGVVRQIKGDKAQLAQALLDALSFDVTKAGATKTLKDDLVALRRLESGIKAQIAVSGRTLELAQQLFDVQQQIADTRKQIAANAATASETRQFRALGLGPGGSDLVQTTANLKKRLPKISALVHGTILDTSATRKMLRGIAKDLSGAYGKLSKDVRSTIQKFFDDIEDQFKKNAVDQTKFKKTNADAFIARFGIGLSPEQRRRLRAGFETLGAGLTTPTRTAQFAGNAGGVTVNGDVHLHNVQDINRLEAQLTKRAKQRPHVRRGAR